MKTFYFSNPSRESLVQELEGAGAGYNANIMFFQQMRDHHFASCSMPHSFARNSVQYLHGTSVSTNLFISGPLISEVTRAITTRATNIFSSISPALSASVPRMISMAPLAFNPKPTAIDSRFDTPPMYAPKEAPASLQTTARK